MDDDCSKKNLYEKLCRLVEKKHKKGEVVVDNLVQENEDVSFLPSKVVVKYLFDTIYVVQFELEEMTYPMYHLTVPTEQKQANSFSSPSNSQGRYPSDKALINTSEDPTFEEQKTPQLCQQESCVLLKSRLKVDLKRMLARHHDYQTALHLVSVKLMELVKTLGDLLQQTLRQISFEKGFVYELKELIW